MTKELVASKNLEEYLEIILDGRPSGSEDAAEKLNIKWGLVTGMHT